VRVEAIPAAHEVLETDDEGRHRLLGFILDFIDSSGLEGSVQRVRVYHSGDCVPYPGLATSLASRGIDLALLPVNGRDERRRALGIAGNFTFEEAVELCRDASIPALMPHHFGMFANNTVSRRELEEKASRLGCVPRCVLPEAGVGYVIREGAMGPHRQVCR
jgi:L-ascorbate metabolism protein UlaG (beta-lactamase superfamily)